MTLHQIFDPYYLGNYNQGRMNGIFLPLEKQTMLIVRNATRYKQ
jgi:hypothetical protein